MDLNTPVEDSWRAVQELIRVGKVRYGGLSNHTVDLIERALTVGPVTSNQVQYNPLQRKIEKDILPFSQRYGIGVLGWGSLAEGFLTDNFNLDKLDPKDFRRNHWNAQPENRVKVERVRETLSKIARAHKCTMVDVVVAWELTHPGLTGAIIGIRSEKEAQEMVAGSKLALTKAEMQEIDIASS
jgi:aryl-alcohol dehydrogenase-like predicted oxidoreductase